MYNSHRKVPSNTDLYRKIGETQVNIFNINQGWRDNGEAMNTELVITAAQEVEVGQSYHSLWLDATVVHWWRLELDLVDHCMAGKIPTPVALS